MDPVVYGPFGVVENCSTCAAVRAEGAALLGTLLYAGEGQRILSYEVVLGRLVMVLHYEAHQGEFRNVDDELESFLPCGVKACRRERAGLLPVHSPTVG